MIERWSSPPVAIMQSSVCATNSSQIKRLNWRLPNGETVGSAHMLLTRIAPGDAGSPVSRILRDIGIVAIPALEVSEEQMAVEGRAFA